MATYDQNIFAVIISTSAIAMGSIVLRIIARRITRTNLWWDDYLAIAAFLFSVAWCATVMLWSFSAGLGRSLADIDTDSKDILAKSRLLLWNAEIFYAFSLACSKLSILSFYWRLFSLSKIRLPIQILAICSIIWLIIRTFMVIFHCVPVQAFWDYRIKDKVCDIDDSKFFLGNVLVHLAIATCILVLPVLQVKDLKLRIGQKVAVMGLFMSGILVCVASVVVLAECIRFELSANELPLNMVSIMVWATVEINFAIISICLPMLRPIFQRMICGPIVFSDPGSKPTSGPRGSGISGPGIRLTTITHNQDLNDTESTRRFAQDIEPGLSHSGGYEGPGPRTVISSHPQRGVSPDPRPRTDFGFNGIQVENRIHVSYEPA